MILKVTLITLTNNLFDIYIYIYTNIYGGNVFDWYPDVASGDEGSESDNETIRNFPPKQGNNPDNPINPNSAIYIYIYILFYFDDYLW